MKEHMHFFWGIDFCWGRFFFVISDVDFTGEIEIGQLMDSKSSSEIKKPGMESTNVLLDDAC